MDVTKERVQEIIETSGVSFQEAKRLALREALLKATHEAMSLNDLRQVVIELIFLSTETRP